MKFVARFRVPTRMLENPEQMKWRVRQEANKKGLALDAKVEYCTITSGGTETIVHAYIPEKRL